MGDDFESDSWEENDDESTILCPYCRCEIFEDSPRCPHCGEYISDEDFSLRRKPWWIILGVLLCLLVIWVWVAQ